MQLTPAQIEEYRREGYLFFPGLFTPAEIKTLNDEVPKLYAEERQENVREKAAPPCAPISPRIPTTTLTAGSAAIRA